MFGEVPDFTELIMAGGNSLGLSWPTGVHFRGMLCDVVLARCHSQVVFNFFTPLPNPCLTGKSLVLNVERLDYSKGLPQKLAAVQRYLEEAKRKLVRQKKCTRMQQVYSDTSTNISRDCRIHL